METKLIYFNTFHYVPNTVSSLLYVNLFNPYKNSVLPYFMNWETEHED